MCVNIYIHSQYHTCACLRVCVWVCVIVRRAPCICSNENKPWNVNGMQHVEQHIALPWAVATQTLFLLELLVAHFYCPAVHLLSRCLSATLITSPAPSLTPSPLWCRRFCTLLTSSTLYTAHTWTACTVDMYWSVNLTGALWGEPNGFRRWHMMVNNASVASWYP